MSNSNAGDLFVLWPDDVEAKTQTVSSMRSIAMSMGGPYGSLRIVEYRARSSDKVRFYRITGGRDGKVGFFVADAMHGFPQKADDYFRRVLLQDAHQFAVDRARLACKAAAMPDASLSSRDTAETL